MDTHDTPGSVGIISCTYVGRIWLPPLTVEFWPEQSHGHFWTRVYQSILVPSHTKVFLLGQSLNYANQWHGHFEFKWKMFFPRMTRKEIPTKHAESSSSPFQGGSRGFDKIIISGSQSLGESVPLKNSNWLSVHKGKCRVNGKSWKSKSIWLIVQCVTEVYPPHVINI